MISKDRLQQALTYLAETDEEAAQARADMARSEFKAKAIKEAVFLRLDGTVAERQAQAISSKEHYEAQAVHFDYLQKYEAIRNKRNTESVVIEVWRSLNAARNKGQIT
jgi:uncharacterized protein YdgA (DUF945 family)